MNAFWRGSMLGAILTFPIAVLILIQTYRANKALGMTPIGRVL